MISKRPSTRGPGTGRSLARSHVHGLRWSGWAEEPKARGRRGGSGVPSSFRVGGLALRPRRVLQALSGLSTFGKLLTSVNSGKLGFSERGGASEVGYRLRTEVAGEFACVYFVCCGYCEEGVLP